MKVMQTLQSVSLRLDGGKGKGNYYSTNAIIPSATDADLLSFAQAIDSLLATEAERYVKKSQWLLTV
jgi:hypothetical protein